jgi:tight adherence protein B
MTPWLIAICVFVGVSAMVGALIFMFRERPGSRVEDRLDLLTGINTPSAAKEGLLKQKSLLTQPLDSRPGLFEVFLHRFADFDAFLQQADVSITVTQLALISALLAAVGGIVPAVLQWHIAATVALPLVLGLLPVTYLWFRRGRRLKALSVQLPDALEMLGRALRAGQSLASGFQMVSHEVAAPLGKEFGRVFEEQNLGIPLEESLRTMTDRTPNLDLKFFATAVILQRQTGGDLAEILDKIGRLIRERFQIWGQIQALTGEGRLSGVVLLGLPVVLFGAVYRLNPDYLSVLFTDPLGKKMLAVAIFLQVVGALCIRKIVNIRV